MKGNIFYKIVSILFAISFILSFFVATAKYFKTKYFIPILGLKYAIADGNNEEKKHLIIYGFFIQGFLIYLYYGIYNYLTTTF